MTNFFFPLYTRVSKSIIHSNKQSTFYTFNMPTLNEDLSPACGREDLSRRSRYASRDGRGKSNWFPSQFPSLWTSVLFLPTDPTLLSVIIYYVRLRANSVRLDTPVILGADQPWQLLLSGFFSALSMDSDLNIPQRVTWGSLKAIPPDNLLMLVRLIDESIAEIPQACSRIRLVERHASADQYWHLLEEGGT